jgi:hypothetical protein
MNYLYSEYGYKHLEHELSNENKIVDYFMDMGADFLECGEGFYTDQDTIRIFLEGKSYAVTIKGEIGSQKQDRGDRLYFIEDIKSVTYEEVETPAPKSRNSYPLDDLINVTEDQYKRVLAAIAQIIK